MFCRRLTAARALSNFTARHNSTLPPLPPLYEWSWRFTTPLFQGRNFLKNQAAAQTIAESFLRNGQDATAGTAQDGEGKIVIEAFPGPGILSRALLSLPRNRLRKLIILEDFPGYLECLKPLEQADDRVKIVPSNGLHWSTYTEIEEAGLLDDCPKVPWTDGVHPSLHLISHIPLSKSGDQMMSQIFRCVPEGSWIFKYGRVPLSLIITENLWKRVVAPIKTSKRCKLSVIADAVAHNSYAVPTNFLNPYEENFFPVNMLADPKQIVSKRLQDPLVAVNILPREKQAINQGTLDQWDYVLRRLFVLKSTSLEKAIPSLAPGAANLLKTMQAMGDASGHNVNTKKKVKELDIADWTIIMQAFKEWPFAPQDLAVTDVLFRDVERH